MLELYSRKANNNSMAPINKMNVIQTYVKRDMVSLHTQTW